MAPTGVLPTPMAFAPTGVQASPVAFAPTAPAPMRSPARLTKPSSGSGLFVGILGVSVLVVALIVGGFVWALGQRARTGDERSTSSRSDRSGKKRKTTSPAASPTSAGETRPSGDLATLTLATVKTRLAASGFEVHNAEPMPNDATITSMGVHGTDGRPATVLFTDDDAGAKSLVRMLGGRQKSAVARKGSRAIAVFGLDDGDGLLDELLGLKKPAPRPETQEPQPPPPAVIPSTVPKPTPTPTPTPTPNPPPTAKTQPKPRPVNPCNCPPNDLMCSMRCSQR